jgi:hypothetical protein
MHTLWPFAAGSMFSGRPSAASSLPTAELAVGSSLNVASITAWLAPSMMEALAARLCRSPIRCPTLEKHSFLNQRGIVHEARHPIVMRHLGCVGKLTAAPQLAGRRAERAPATSEGDRIMSLDACAPKIMLNADSKTLLPDPLAPEMTLRPGPNSTYWCVTSAKSWMSIDSRYVLSCDWALTWQRAGCERVHAENTPVPERQGRCEAQHADTRPEPA